MDELLLAETAGKKKDIVNLLSFIPQVLRDEIDDSNEIEDRLINKISGEEQLCTALFDLSSLAKLDHLDTRAEKLNDAFEFIIHLVEESNGDIVSFLGDVLICVFRSDTEAGHAKSTFYATKCAKSVVHRFQLGVSEDSFKNLKIKVGVGFGRGGLVHVGVKETSMYFLIGESLDAATNSLQLTNYNEVVLCPNSVRLLGEIKNGSVKELIPVANNVEFCVVGEVVGMDQTIEFSPTHATMQNEVNDENRRRRRTLTPPNPSSTTLLGRGSPSLARELDSPMLNPRDRMSRNSTISSFSKLMCAKSTVDMSKFLIKVKRFVPKPVLIKFEQDSEIKMRDMDEIRTVTTVFINIDNLNGWDDISLNDLAKNAEPLFAHVFNLACKPHHEGMVQQFVVDQKSCKVVVCFGVQGYSHQDDPTRAVNFALAVKNAIHYATATVGITTTKAFCGTVGSLQRREYAIMGEGYSIARGLTAVEENNSRIVMDSSTFTSVAKFFDVDELGKVNIGQELEEEVMVESFQPLVLKPTTVNFEKEDNLFVGRTIEKKMVLDAIYFNRIVCLKGSEGSGKSSMLKYMHAVAKRVGFAAHMTVANSTHKLPYFALRSVTKQILRIDTDGWDDLSPEQKISHISQQIRWIVDSFSSKEKESMAHLRVGGFLGSIPSDVARTDFSSENEPPSSPTNASPLNSPNNRGRTRALSSSSGAGTVLESSMQKHGNTRPSSATNSDSGLSSDGHEVSNRHSSGRYHQLLIEDVLCLIHSVMDFGITAPLTKTIQKMSNVSRASIISKFLYHLLSSQQKTLIIIDEAQYLDLQSWTLIERMARRCENLSFLFSGSFSKLMNVPNFKKMTKQKRFTKIALEKMTKTEVKMVCENISKGKNWPDDVIDMIFEQSKGHPKHCVALVETLLITKKVVVVEKKGEGEGEAEFEVKISEVESIKKTIFAHQANSESAKVAAFDSLDPLRQYLLKIAAVFERYFAFDYLASILPYNLKKDTVVVKAAFVGLCSNGWFQPDNFEGTSLRGGNSDNETDSYINLLKKDSNLKTFSFCESGVQQIVYELIPESTTRKELHIETAHCLYNFFEDDLQSIFPLLCHHFNIGGDEEEELKMVQMAAAGHVREGLLEEAIVKFERALELAETSEFHRFEAFDKGQELAGWSLSLAECYYVVGSLHKCKMALVDALDFLKNGEKGGGTGGGWQRADAKDLLPGYIKKHAWLMFKEKQGEKKYDRKDDKLATSTEVKVLGRLFLLSAMDLNLDDYLSAGIGLLEILVGLGSEQGNVMGCFVSMLLQQTVAKPGMVIKKGFSTLCNKAMGSFENTGLFKIPTWAYLSSLSSVYWFGSNLEKSTKFAKDAYQQFNTLSNTSGQLESLFCLCNCEQSGREVGGEIKLLNLHSLSEAVKNVIANIWYVYLVIGNFGSITKGEKGGEEADKVRDALEILRGVVETKQFKEAGKSLQICAFSSDAIGTLILNEEGGGDRALEYALRALGLMKEATLGVTYMKEAYLNVAEVMLYLHKEKQMDEHKQQGQGEVLGRNNNLVVKSENLSGLKEYASEALACCKKLGNMFDTCSSRVDGLEGLVDLIHQKTTISKVKGLFKKLAENANKQGLKYDSEWLASFTTTGSLELYGMNESVHKGGKAVMPG